MGAAMTPAHKEVLRGPRLKIEPGRVDVAIARIRKAGAPVGPNRTVMAAGYIFLGVSGGSEDSRRGCWEIGREFKS